MYPHIYAFSSILLKFFRYNWKSTKMRPMYWECKNRSENNYKPFYCNVLFIRHFTFAFSNSSLSISNYEIELRSMTIFIRFIYQHFSQFLIETISIYLLWISSECDTFKIIVKSTHNLTKTQYTFAIFLIHLVHHESFERIRSFSRQ